MKRRYKAHRAKWKKTGDPLRDRYNAYLRAFEKQKSKLAKRGLEMNDEKYSFSEWEEQWIRKRNDLQYEVNLGERRGIGNVNQYLVRDQAYELSYKQGEAIYRAMSDRGELQEGISKITYMTKIRQGEWLDKIGWWENIKELREELRKKGFNNEEIKNKISHQIYGSK